MKKVTTTNVILGTLIVLLGITTVLSLAGLLWQQGEIQKLRQQLTVVPAAPEEMITATNVCQSAQNGDLPPLKRLLDQHPELLNTAAAPGRTSGHGR